MKNVMRLTQTYNAPSTPTKKKNNNMKNRRLIV